MEAVKPGWKLVWSDEFNGPNGSAPDPHKWTHDVGGDGWGNHELEYYTDRTDNASVHDGNLEIVARREPYSGPDGTSQPYTSARLHTLKTFAQRYGRFEARIKIPAGEGMWPAFWMLGQDIDTQGWPGCGEIDVMENIGKEPGTVHGSLHGPGYDMSGGVTLPDKKPFSDGFHEFAVEWKPDTIQYFVDGKPYETVTPEQMPAGKKWVFDQPFSLLLNLAVGGDWPGPPDNKTQFPGEMLVDYVRVYAPAS